MVVLAGICGYLLSPHRHDPERRHEPIVYNLWGQVFGYICTVFYLGSRLPQMILNFRRKTCEGLSLLFFLFACLGNVTYVISIISAALLAGMSKHGTHIENPDRVWLYLSVNASWLIGSAGTLALDGVVCKSSFITIILFYNVSNICSFNYGLTVIKKIFVQFFMYGEPDFDSDSDSCSSGGGGGGSSSASSIIIGSTEEEVIQQNNKSAPLFG